MFERYTSQARRTAFLAREEAAKAGSVTIKAEHLLLGLLREDAAFLGTLLPAEASEESFRVRLAGQMPAQPSLRPDSDLRFDKESKRALAYAAEESKSLGHRHIGTEHLLLGILREKGCFAERFLTQCGADEKTIRRLLATGPRTAQEPQRLIMATVSRGELKSSGSVRGAIAFYLGMARKKLASLGYPAAAPGRFSRSGMEFHRFTERARRVIFFARYEASQLGSPVTEPEHVLLGIARELHRDLADFLPAGELMEALREQLECRDKKSPSADLPISKRTKHIFIAAQNEALHLDALSVGPEHLLLAILGEEEGLAGKFLRNHGIDAARLRSFLGSEPEQSSSGHEQD